MFSNLETEKFSTIFMLEPRWTLAKAVSLNPNVVESTVNRV